MNYLNKLSRNKRNQLTLVIIATIIAYWVLGGNPLQALIIWGLTIIIMEYIKNLKL